MRGKITFATRPDLPDIGSQQDRDRVNTTQEKANLRQEGWQDRFILIPGRTYRLVTRYTDADVVYLATDEDDGNPVFSFNGVSLMVPWPAIEQIYPAGEEKTE